MKTINVVAALIVHDDKIFAKQISQRRQGVEGAFGEEYADYKKRVRRYL